MGGGEIKIVFNILKMSNFLLEIWENSEKKTLIFGGLKTKREGGEGSLKIDYRRLSMSVFFAASIPKLRNQVSDVSAQFVGSTFDHNHYSMIIIE